MTDYDSMNAVELCDLLNSEHPDAWSAAAQVWAAASSVTKNASVGMLSAHNELSAWSSSNSVAAAAFTSQTQVFNDRFNDWLLLGTALAPKLQTVSDALLTAQRDVTALADQRIELSSRADLDDYGRQALLELVDRNAAVTVQQVADLMNSAFAGHDNSPATDLGLREVDQPGQPPAGPPSTPPSGPPDGGAPSGPGLAGEADPSAPQEFPFGPPPAAPPAAAAAAPDPLTEANAAFGIANAVGSLINLPVDIFSELFGGLNSANTLSMSQGSMPKMPAMPKAPTVPKVPWPTVTTPQLEGGPGAAPAADALSPSLPPLGSDPSGLGPVGGLGALPALGGLGAGSGLRGSLANEPAASEPSDAVQAGEVGAEPTLAEDAAPAETAPQSGMPMYPPPMGGMGAAGAGAGAGQVRPGAAPSRSGFSVAAEPNEQERLRRNGVQSDLQGRTTGDAKSAARKRAAAARPTATSDVLDEELWRV